MSFLKNRSEKLFHNALIKTSKNNTNNTNNNKENNDSNDYDKFIEDGGIKGEAINDRGSTFQAHIIKVTKPDQVKIYLKYLKTHNKIQKATHNILAYRIIEQSNNKKSKSTCLEGSDDDGEEGAGARLLGFLQKMGVANIMVVVSRWFGGTMLGNDRFKHINDSCKNVIMNNKNKFDFII
jgi:hypothetical protein